MVDLKIGVVLVTYNRKDKLITALRHYEEQILLPSFIVVVDNASNDGTHNFLETWKNDKTEFEKHIITNQKNLGGSGGFHVGLKYALALEADWIWVSDDDAYPNKDVFQVLSEFIDNYNDSDNIVALCGTVYVNGAIDESHRRIAVQKKFRIQDTQVPVSSYDQEYFEINEFSYVGTMISSGALENAGLVNKDYFIHYDDTEHSLRLSKFGKIICIPKVKIVHDINQIQSSSNKLYLSSWTKYYDYRNLLDMYRSVFPYKYYCIQYALYKIKSILFPMFGLNRVEKNILDAAINDAKKNVLGIHTYYKPGWRVEKEK